MLRETTAWGGGPFYPRLTRITQKVSCSPPETEGQVCWKPRGWALPHAAVQSRVMALQPPPLSQQGLAELGSLFQGQLRR